MNPVNSISIPPLTVPEFAPDKAATTQETSSFKDFLLSSIGEVNSLQQAADQAVQGLATGEPVNPAEVLTAVQKADIAFRMMMQIRNKMVQAYQEVQAIRV